MTQFTKTVSISEGQHASLTASGHIGTLGDPQAVTVIRSASHALAMTQSEAISAQKQLTRPAVILSSPEAFSIPRAMAHNVAPSTAGLVSAGKAIARAVMASDGQNLAALRRTARPLALAMAESLVRLLTPIKPFALTDGETLSAARGYPRTTAPLSPSSLSLSELKLFGRIVSITEGEIVTAAKQTAKGVSFADSEAINQSVIARWSRSLAAGSQLGFVRVPGRLAAFADPATVSGVQRLVIARSASVPQGELVTASAPAIRLYGASIAAAIPINIVRRVAHAVSVAQGAALLTAKFATKTISASLAELVALGQQTAHGALLLSTNALAAGRKIGHRQGLSQSQIVTHGRANAKNVTSALPEALALLRAGTFGLLQNFSQPSILRVVKNNMPAIAFASGSTIIIVRQFTKAIAQIISNTAIAIRQTSALRSVSLVSGNAAVAITFIRRAGVVVSLVRSPQQIQLFLARTLTHPLSWSQGNVLSSITVPIKHTFLLANQIATTVNRQLGSTIGVVQAARIITRAVGTLASSGSTQLLSVFTARTGPTLGLVGLLQPESTSASRQATLQKTIILPADPVIAFNPPAPSIPNTTPLGARVAQIIVTMTDGSPFAGQLSFGPPNQNDSGIYAIDNNIAPVTYTGNNFITINPTGPGVGAEGGNIDNITAVATVVPTRMFNMISSTRQRFASAHPVLVLLSSPQSMAMRRFVSKALAALTPQLLAAQNGAAHFRTLATAHAQISAVARAAIKNLPAVALGQVVASGSRIGKTIRAFSAAVASTNKQRFKAAVFNIAEALTAAGQRTTGRQSVSLASGQSAALVRQPQKLILPMLGSQISRIMGIARAVVLAMPETLIGGRLKLSILAFSHAQSVTALRQSAHQRTIAMVSSLFQTLRQVHVFYLNVTQTLVQANVNRIGKLVRVLAPYILARTTGRFVAIAAGIAQSVSVATVNLRHGGVQAVIAQTQRVTSIASAVRPWPHGFDPTAMIASAQRLVVDMASAIAPILPTSAVLRLGRALRPLYARRRFIKR
jgi:hypothetical protein